MESSDWSQLLPEARYGRFNFQREPLLERLEEICLADEGPSVVLLEGDTGSGRAHGLEVVGFRLGAKGHPVQILTLDLEGFEPDLPGGLGRYVAYQVERRREGLEAGRRDEWCQELVTAGRRLASSVGDSTVAAIISLCYHLEDPIGTLQEFVEREEGQPGERLHPRQAPRQVLGDFLEWMTERGSVLVHVSQGEALTAPLLRWLTEIAQRVPRLVLAVSCADSLLALPKGVEREVLPFSPLSLHEIEDLLDLRFSPNSLPVAFAQSLLGATKGRQSFVMAKVHKLVREGYLVEDDQGVWRLPPEQVERALEEGFKDGLRDLIDQDLIDQDLGELSRENLEEFLCRAALCGSLVPAEIVFDSMKLEPAEREGLEDFLDEQLAAGGEKALFDEPRHDPPSFPHAGWVYKFKNVQIPSLCLLKLKDWEIQERARELLSLAEENIPPSTRSTVQMLLSLAGRLGRSVSEPYRHRLAWWVGEEEAEALRDGLSEDLKEESLLDGETLWSTVQATQDLWPPYRRLSLLDAYAGNLEGLPAERGGEVLYVRATLLRAMGRSTEALPNAVAASAAAKKEAGEVSERFASYCLLEALLLHETEQHQQAQNLLESVLEGCQEKSWFPELLGVAMKSALGSVLSALGDLAGARDVQISVLARVESLLGDSHPSTLAARSALSRTLFAGGDLVGARELQASVLSSKELLFGDSHPSTLSARSSLAQTLRAQGDFAGARKLEESVLETLTRVLGPEHPNTLTARNNLAGALFAQGDLAGARELQEPLLDSLTRILGPEHPNTLVVKNNLVAIRKAQAEAAEV